ncbi:Retinal cone rhodopsin-sensitive cGMP 3',5'-cyclic phosphodiesterase subunit gamma [Aix galericulata]|nr:Retinal cone rhodopsin-sensitive cGMP 3',5'-cyclic phosphodiesterase subunit gamma [Aix galericulata]
MLNEAKQDNITSMLGSIPAMSENPTTNLNTGDAPTGPTTPRKGPPKFKQRQTRQFKSKPPKKGVKGFGDDIPGMEGLGTDITVICPWEAFSHLELHELAQFGII